MIYEKPTGDDPIQSRFLDSRDLFALRYEEGLVFMEVEEFENTDYEEFGELEDIESGTNLDDGFQRLEDSNSDDLLHVPPGNENMVMHVGIGISPSVIEMYVAYPEGNRSKGSIPDLSTQPLPGSNFGGIDGDDSPYRKPTVASELIIPPGVFISVDFHNPGDDSHEPVLKFVYRKYKVNVLNPNSSSDKDAVSKIARPGSPAPIFPVGNMIHKENFNMGSEWGVNPIRRKRAMGGGRR